METNNQNQKNDNLSLLISKLKIKDTYYARISKAFQTIYIIFIPLYLVLTLLEYFETHQANVLISGGCFIISFLIFIVIFRNYYKKYNYVDYSLPTVEMLKKAAARYQPFQKGTLYALLAVIVMDVGLTLDWLDRNTSVLFIQIIFWSAIFLAILIGLLVWYIRYKPVRDEALRLIKEIEEE